MDGRKSTDREPRQGNLLGKTSSSTQAVDPFSVDRSLPLSLSLSRPPPRPSPHYLLLISFALFYPPRLLSISFSLLSLYLAPRIPASPATLCLSPSFASFAISLRPRNPSSFISCRSFDTTLSDSFPFLSLASPFHAFALYLRAPLRSLSPPPFPHSSCNFVRQIIFLAFLPNIFRSRFSAFFVLPSFLPFLPTHTHTHTHIYILHALETV